jgi:hypothetical protein
MTGAKMQPEFNANMDKQPANNYTTIKSGGALQDDLREHEGKPAADQVTDKFSDNAGDNALTRYEINRSIVSPEVANEHSYANALNKGLEQIGKKNRD